MTNKEVLTQDLLNLIHVCASRLHELTEYTEDELTISNNDLTKVAESLQYITKLTIVDEIPF